jgi:hypothetical protein
MPVRIVCFACCLFLGCVASLGQGTSATESATSSASFVVNVIATGKHGDPLEPELTREDFQLLDNRVRVPIESFSHVSGNSARPLVLWLIVECPQRGPGYDAKAFGSGFLLGKSELLTPALGKLAAQETVGVAHWCDNGSYNVDLFPTADRDAPASSIQNVLSGQDVAINTGSSAPAPGGRGLRGSSAGQQYLGSNLGQQALSNLIMSVGDLSRLMTPGSLPVLVFLYGDAGGTDQETARAMLQDVFAASATVYLLNNGAVIEQASRSSDTRAMQMYFVHFLSEKTGGRAAEAWHNDYDRELERIVAEIRSRYELGFEPAAMDSKQHDLQVRLTPQARARLGRVKLRYTSGYVASPPPEPAPDSRMAAALVQAIRSQSNYSEIVFDASGQALAPGALSHATKPVAPVDAKNDLKNAATERGAGFRLYIGPQTLGWRKRLNGALSATIGIAVAGITPENEVVSVQSTQLEAAQSVAEASSPTRKAVVMNIAFAIPDRATRIRFVVRDSESGRIGSFELPVDRIHGLASSNAPAKASAQRSN